jgi:hypothetical protein
MIMRSIVAICCVAGLLLLTAATPGVEPPDSHPESMPKGVAINWDKPIEFRLDSHGVEWRGNRYHLVQLGTMEFHLDKESGALKGEIKGAYHSFDDVDYEISAAVFDRDDALLGVAKTNLHVPRIWLGKIMMTSVKLDLDFGASLDYERAASFKVAISKRKVLTPDQWQK